MAGHTYGLGRRAAEQPRPTGFWEIRMLKRDSCRQGNPRFGALQLGASLLLAGAFGVACGSGNDASASHPMGGSGGSGGAVGSGGPAVGGTSGSAGTASGGTTGGAGTPASGGVPVTAGTGGTPATGGAGGTQTTGGTSGGGTTGGTGGDFPKADCAPGAIFCEDFEQYLVQPAFDGNVLRDFIKIGETTPTWLGYHFHGPPYVVLANVFGGKQVYQFDTEGGHPVAADIIKESPDGVDLWPAAHYGRFMVNLKGLPVTGAVGIMSESGLLPGSTTNTAQYTLGAVDGKLSFSYSQRVRPFKNDVSTPMKRIGGNWEQASQMPTTLCTVAATTQTIPAGKWTCVEWMIDRTKPELHVWLDGVPQTQLDVSGAAGTCSAGTAPTWTGPAHFTELDLGWEINGNDAGGRGAQFDMFAIGTQQLGCATP